MKNTWIMSGAVAIAVGLTIVSGLWQGQISLRWGVAAPIQEAASRLEQIPVEFGSWKMDQVFDVEPDVQAILQCSGYVNRRYVNLENNSTIHVAVILGPANTMSVHSPEVCYSGAGYSTLTDTKVFVTKCTDGKEDELNQVVLARDDDDSSTITVGYGWSTGERFEAPGSPRWAFRKAPYLYKIQLASHSTQSALSDDAKKADHDEKKVLEEFLRDFLPVLRPCLVNPNS